MPELLRGAQILMTTDTIGGVWDYSLELAAGLARHDIGTVLATMGRLPSAEQRKAARAIPGLIVEESSFLLEWMPAAGDDPERAGDWLLQLEDRYRPDLIHLNGYAQAGLAWQAPCLVVAHSCVLSWWQAVKGEPAPKEWSAYADRVGRGLRQAAAVVAPTGALLQAMEKIYGLLPHARVIWNGRRPEHFHPEAKGRYIFSAGRLWDEAKNLSALSAIANDLNWLIVAAGEWRRPEGGGKRPAGVEFLGHLSQQELASWLSRAPIYALPARYEPFGLTVLEAALSGCALVLGDIPSLRELWDGAAMFIPPDDHHRLGTALQGLIRDDGLREALGRAARGRACLYGSARMTAEYRRLYSQLLAARTPQTVVPGTSLAGEA